MTSIALSDLFLVAAFIVVAVTTGNALVHFAAVQDMPKPAPRLTLRWVWSGLTEPEPWDDTVFGRSLDEIYGGRWAGETTSVFPMVLALKDEPEEWPAPVDAGFVGRERFVTAKPKARKKSAELVTA